MNTSLKKILSLLLAAVLLLGIMAGCAAEASNPELDQFATVDEKKKGSGKPGKEETKPAEEPKEESGSAGVQPGGASDVFEVEAGQQIKYVMIYNPRVYVDESNTGIRNTGDISAQVDVSMSRADGLTEADKEPFDQFKPDEEFMKGIDLSGGRAEGLGKTYRVGDRENFYCATENDVNQRTEKTFTCVYAGSHANIWVYETVAQNAADKLGQTFDREIYDSCVDLFGEPRFGEVVNVLLYSFRGNPNTVGFFHPYDLFSATECSAAEVKRYGVNTDINVININAMWLSQSEETVISTLAHEFQHLLCFTGYFSAGNQCDVWFNEAMSGYIEEVLYKGSKESDFACYHSSGLIRGGQSLYNFKTEVTATTLDIGVYGSVFLFSEYLKNLAGDDVFSNFHANWRKTYKEMDTFTGIYRVMPKAVLKQVDALVEYPSSYRFSSEEQEWISKLTLSFYLSTFTKDSLAAENYKDIQMPYLVYDSIMSADIEGGGRVILAVKDGAFQIPEDADQGLVYVGLNENMEIVTNIVCK